jgi:integrase
MILLGCNGALGNSDLSSMPISAVDLERGWITYPRVKTGIERRFAVWKETAQAIRQVLAKRVEPKDEADAGLLFITSRGLRWCRGSTVPGQGEVVQVPDGTKAEYHSSNSNRITEGFNRLFEAAGIERNGRSFYSLRHTFETIAGESIDQVAVSSIMGHVDSSMAAHYRERISDERLKAVTDHVRAWLLAKRRKN